MRYHYEKPQIYLSMYNDEQDERIRDHETRITILENGTVK